MDYSPYQATSHHFTDHPSMKPHGLPLWMPTVIHARRCTHGLLLATACPCCRWPPLLLAHVFLPCAYSPHSPPSWVHDFGVQCAVGALLIHIECTVYFNFRRFLVGLQSNALWCSSFSYGHSVSLMIFHLVLWPFNFYDSLSDGLSAFLTDSLFWPIASSQRPPDREAISTGDFQC